MENSTQSLIFKVSDGVYKKYLEAKQGIRACTGKLKNKEIEELFEDLDLLNYIEKNKSCSCDETKLIDYLT